MKLDLTTAPSPEDAKTLSEGLRSFNQAAIGEKATAEAELGFSVFARDDDGVVIGGLRATCFWDTLHVECTWLSEEARGQGTGTALLAAAERFAVQHGFEQALLETTTWQARPFYEKLGYEVVATLPNYPKGHAMHLLRKLLVDRAEEA
ncbi:MAG: GNAT family N-acetyltransferase [Acidobacteriota bacterium]